jgi:hypothetical protein
VWRGSLIRSQESSRSRPSASSLFSLRSLMIPSDSSQGMISSSNVPYSAVAKVCRMPAPTQLPPSSTVAARHCAPGPSHEGWLVCISTNRRAGFSEILGQDGSLSQSSLPTRGHPSQTSMRQTSVPLQSSRFHRQASHVSQHVFMICNSMRDSSHVSGQHPSVPLLILHRGRHKVRERWRVGRLDPVADAALLWVGEKIFLPVPFKTWRRAFLLTG